MSLDKLVGGDCGGNNPLVQLSNIVARDAGQAQPRSLADQYVSDFLAENNAQVPQTFNMNTLLNSIPRTGSTQGAQIIPGPTSLEVGQNSSQMINPWMPRPSMPFIPQQPMMRNFMPMHPVEQQRFIPILPAQYLAPKMQNDDLRAKAQEYVEKTKHYENITHSHFMSLMKKISAGEMKSEAAQATEPEKTREQVLDEISAKYREKWQELSDVTDIWDAGSATGIPKEYEFAESNEMLENKSAFELGKEKLQMGDIPGAVICFEAAAQQQPDSAVIWFYLGSTQAENEQDPLAITALKKSIDLDPAMQEAYLILAAAYANENMPKNAYLSLLDWLKNSSRYNDLPSLDFETTGIDMSSLQSRVQNLYLNAARRDPKNVDPEVQNALGVVFNLTQEYEKAVDCFKTALMVQSDNPQLWNKLGATLANSNRSEEAVEAYHEALNLEPGFVRARYNVGITCMNLGAHKQAAEHFLVALNQQHKAESVDPELCSTTSPAIWMTLRMVCSYMGEHKVAELVDKKNLTELNKFFEIDA